MNNDRVLSHDPATVSLPLEEKCYTLSNALVT
jgi:hypothetical protein